MAELLTTGNGHKDKDSLEPLEQLSNMDEKNIEGAPSFSYQANMEKDVTKT